jgi:signal transduction histidine kinase
VDERIEQLGFKPDVLVDERLDDQSDALAGHVLATLSEALSNVARHARANAAVVSLRCTDRMMELVVTDNGVGPPSTPPVGGGLTNMSDRAAELGGTCRIGAADPTGTQVVWSIPVGS